MDTLSNVIWQDRSRKIMETALKADQWYSDHEHVFPHPYKMPFVRMMVWLCHFYIEAHVSLYVRELPILCIKPRFPNDPIDYLLPSSQRTEQPVHLNGYILITQESDHRQLTPGKYSFEQALHVCLHYFTGELSPDILFVLREHKVFSLHIEKESLADQKQISVWRDLFSQPQ